jgi:hypothetical protein
MMPFAIWISILSWTHDRMIEKALDGKINPDVKLKERIALGDNYSRHVITTSTANKDVNK